MDFKTFIKEPITAYHGSSDDIQKFSGVVYFTPQKDAAFGYAKGKRKQGTPRVYEVKLRFKNLKNYESMQEIGSLSKSEIEKLKTQGFDGAFYDGSGKEPIPEYLPFYPEKLKISKIHEIK